MTSDSIRIARELARIARELVSETSNRPGNTFLVNFEENVGYTREEVEEFYERDRREQGFEGTFSDYVGEITGKNGSCERIEDYERRISEEVEEMPAGDFIKRYDGIMVVKDALPDWSLEYLVYGDASKITAEQRRQADAWKGRRNVVSVEIPSKGTDVGLKDLTPVFGEADSTTVCVFRRRID